MYILCLYPVVIFLLFGIVISVAKKNIIITSILLLLLLLLNIYGEVFTFGRFFTDSELKGKKLRVMSYNVNGWNHYQNKWNDISEDSLLNYIISVNPDVLALSEFIPIESEILSKGLKEKYCYSNEADANGAEIEPLIYSKYPIRNVHREDFRTCCVDMNVNGKEIRVTVCYLQSNLVSLANGVSDLYNGIKDGYNKRAEQTDVALNRIKDYTGEVLVMGDMNDVSGSYTLRKLESAGLKDAWWSGGSGMGLTYSNFPFYYRLDHILYSDGLKLTNIEIPNVDYSDHYPMVADFCIN